MEARIDLTIWAGKTVVLVLPNGTNIFGPLQKDPNDVYFIPGQLGFKKEAVMEIIPIEVEEEKNAARAAIYLK